MFHQIQLRSIAIQPFRIMAASHKMYFVHPWGELLHAAEPILQIVPIPETYLPRIALIDQGVLAVLRPPLGIVAIHPYYNKIHKVIYFTFAGKYLF